MAVARRVSAVRALPGDFSPPCRVLPAAQVSRELDRKLRRDLPLPPELYLDAVFRLGLMDPPSPDLYSRLLEFYSRQVLGFFEPTSREMVIVQGAAVPESSAPLVWAHELAHAAQEARFGLPSHLVGLTSNADAQRAAAAMAEGDATLVMFLVASQPGSSLPDPEVFRAAQEQAVAASPGIPPFFLEDLIFPYAAGYQVVLSAYRRGGWAAVDRLLASPPSSTAELLAPHRPPPGPPLANDVLPGAPEGFDEVLTNTLGQWGLQQWLGRSLPAVETAALAETWDADRFRLVRSLTAPHQWGLVWRIRCRSQADRVLLERVMRRLAPEHLRGLTAPGPPPRIQWLAFGAELEVRAAWPREP